MHRKLRGLKGEDGVAMTEFALILPVFIVIVVGLLSFGRALFYWIEANHLANETVRWAVVDRNPDAAAYPTPATALQSYARDQGGTVEFHNATVCIDVPDDDDDTTTPPPDPTLGGPLEVKISKPFSFISLRWFDVGKITIQGRATMRIERFEDGTAPTNYGLGCTS
jgi:Flp pilus assembly protein TadG